MATLEDIFNFEFAMQEAAATAFFNAYSISIRKGLDRGMDPHQFVGVAFTKGAAQDHHHIFADGTEVVDGYQGTLTFIVRTLRESEDAVIPVPLHFTLCSYVRAFMANGARKINALLNLHAITSWPVPDSGEMQHPQGRYDFTEIPYSLTFCVKKTAWPATLS